MPSLAEECNLKRKRKTLLFEGKPHLCLISEERLNSFYIDSFCRISSNVERDVSIAMYLRNFVGTVCSEAHFCNFMVFNEDLLSNCIVVSALTKVVPSEIFID